MLRQLTGRKIEPTDGKYVSQGEHRPTSLMRKSLLKYQEFSESIKVGAWEKSNIQLEKICCDNLSYSEAHVKEFIKIWCDFCNGLLQNEEINEFIDIFVEIYRIGERNSDVETLICNLFDKYNIEELLKSKNLEYASTLKLSYAHYKSLSNEHLVCSEFAISCISSAKELLEKEGTEDFAWSLVRRSLPLISNKELARSTLDKLLSGLRL